MKTLSYAADVNGFVPPRAQVTLTTGREFWVCNPMEELTSAIDDGKPFKAHTVIGLRPKEVIINPEHVAAIEDRT